MNQYCNCLQQVVSLIFTSHFLIEFGQAKQNDVDNLSSLVGYMTPYFPSTGGMDGKVILVAKQFTASHSHSNSLIEHAKNSISYSANSRPYFSMPPMISSLNTRNEDHNIRIYSTNVRNETQCCQVKLAE